MKKITSLLLAGLLCANLTAPALAAEDTADTAAPGKTVVTFTDMPSSPEFVESITWAVENDITTGMYDGQFWPDYTLQYLADPHVHLAHERLARAGR